MTDDRMESKRLAVSIAVGMVAAQIAGGPNDQFLAHLPFLRHGSDQGPCGGRVFVDRLLHCRLGMGQTTGQTRRWIRRWIRQLDQAAGSGSWIRQLIEFSVEEEPVVRR